MQGTAAASAATRATCRLKSAFTPNCAPLRALRHALANVLAKQRHCAVITAATTLRRRRAAAALVAVDAHRAIQCLATDALAIARNLVIDFAPDNFPFSSPPRPARERRSTAC
jgi:hypothetical protein